MSTSTSWQTLFPQIARHVYSGKDIIDITGTGTAVGTVVDSTRAYTGRSANAYDGVGMFCYSADSAAPEGEFRRVTSGGFAGATGTWTVAPDWTAAPAAGDKFILMRGGLDDNQFLDAANAVITAHAWPQYLAATMIVDGNFTAADPATGWADVTGTPTQTAETTEVLTGKQSMKVVYTVVDTSVGCAAVPVTESEQLLVWAVVKCTAGSLRVQLWDNTNGAEIDGTTVDEEAWTIVALQNTNVPDDCQNVSVRLVNKTAATTAYIDHVGLLSQDRELYEVIPEITDASHIERAMHLPLRTPSEASDAWVWGEEFEPWPGGEALKDYFAVNSHRANLQRPSIYPIFWQFRDYESDLTALSSTTVAPADVVEYGAAAELLERWADRLDGDERGKKLAKAAKCRQVYASVMSSIQLDRPTVTFHNPRVAVP